MDFDDDTIRNTDGGIIFRFKDSETKKTFVNQISQMCETARINREEGYKCGHCAAQPCFRHRRDSNLAGLCFQRVRLCRQECDNYITTGQGSAKGGICKIDGQKVAYEQECHIPKMKSKK